MNTEANMRPQKLQIRIDNSIMTIVDNGKKKIFTVRHFKDEVFNENSIGNMPGRKYY